ncbi:MAG: hydroxyacylglutathione hydrolase [Bdellovibrionaceae bacterium]|nr:hydroxyacylglutathione hydrolase [Pseudobdellovibrionaceae bacterium]
MIEENTFLNFSVFTIPVLKDNYVFVIKAHKTTENLTDTWVIDPALAKPVIEFLQTKKWSLNAIVNTHHHEDHTGGNLELKTHYNASILAPQNDPIVADQKLSQNSNLHFAKEPVQIIEVPGHTLGHIVYYFAESKVAFVGDCLFSLGCGRLFEGSPKQMLSALNKIAQLPDDTSIFCAHEYSLANAKFALQADPENLALQKKITQIQNLRKQNKFTIPFNLGLEKQCNPFLRSDSVAIKKYLHLPNSCSTEESFAKLRKLKDTF